MVQNTFVLAQNYSNASPTDEPSVRNFSSENVLQNTQIYSVSTDRRGLVYCANNSGVLEYDGVEWRTIDVPENQSILALQRDSKGRIYASGEGILGYLIVDRNGNTSFQKLDSFSKKEYNDTFFDIQIIGEVVYFVGIRTIVRFSDSNITQFGNGSFVSSAVVLNKLVVNDQKKGLLVVHGEELSPLGNLSYMRATSMVALNDSSILVATRSNGLKRLTYTNNQVSVSDWGNFTSSLSDLSSIALYNNEIVAIGSFSQGVIIANIEGKVMGRIDVESGLANNTIYDVFITPRATLWIGRNEGVSLANLTDMFSSIKPVELPDSLIIHPSKSLDAPEINLAENDSWFGNYVDQIWNWLFGSPDLEIPTPPDEKSEAIFASIVRKVEYIPNDSLIFGGAYAQSEFGVQSLKQSDSLIYEFEYDFNAFRFSYATNQYEELGSIEYRVKLEGLDQTWSTWSSNTYREYTNLDWGDYTFLVQARSESQEISAPATFSFFIIAPWYESTWFYLAQVSCLLGALVVSGILNKAGKAISLSEALIAVVVIVIFQYVDFHIDPYLDEYSNDIAIFKILISIIFGFSLEFIEEMFHKLIAKITGLSETKETLESVT